MLKDTLNNLILDCERKKTYLKTFLKWFTENYDKLSMDYKISGILHVIPEYQRKYEDSLINLIKFEENLW